MSVGVFFKSWVLRLVEPDSDHDVNVSPLPASLLSRPSKQLQQKNKNVFQLDGQRQSLNSRNMRPTKLDKILNKVQPAYCQTPIHLTMMLTFIGV